MTFFPSNGIEPNNDKYRVSSNLNTVIIDRIYFLYCLITAPIPCSYLTLRATQNPRACWTQLEGRKLGSPGLLSTDTIMTAFLHV